MMRHRWFVLGGLLGVAVALAALWSYSPLAAWTQAANVIAWAREAGALPWVPVAVLAAYTPASVTLFPRPLITLFAVLAFGPWLGFLFAFAGIMIAALATYALGVMLDRSRIRRLVGRRVVRLRVLLRRRGVLAMTAVRLVPIAPFVVVNVVAGALRVRLAHFAAGSALGILPGTAAATVLGDQITVALHAPHAINFPVVAAALAVLLGAAFLTRRWLMGRWKAR